MVGHGHGCGHNVVETLELREARIGSAVFLLELPEEIDGIIHDVVEMVLHLLNVEFDVGDVLLCLLDVKFRNLADRLLAKGQHIVAGDLLMEEGTIRVEGALDVVDLEIPGFDILFEFLIDSLLEEDLFQGDLVPLAAQLVQFYLQFPTKQVERVLGIDLQNLLHIGEDGVPVPDDASIGGIGDFTVGEGIQGIDRLVGGNARHQVEVYFHMFGGVVVDLLDLELAHINSGGDGVLGLGDEFAGGGAVWDLGDDKGFVIDDADLGAVAHLAALRAIGIATHIGHASSGKIGVNLEILAPENVD